MVTQKQFREHYQNLYKTGAIYLWGANGEVITKDLCDRLYNWFHSATYDRKYYDDKLKEGVGKIGADCSGSICPLSNADNTAAGYYNLCPASQRGSISSLPRNTACLVFNKDLTHVGAYMGDGTTIEMQSSKANCVKQNLVVSRWAYWGIPTWLETDTSNITLTTQATTRIEKTTTGTKPMKSLQEWCNNYCNAGLEVDGYFGPLTKKGLAKALQHCLNTEFGQNLEEDGVFGVKTKAACKNASCSKNLTYIAQAMLYARGYDLSSMIKGNNFDSAYGNKLKAIIREFQSATRGLVVDGECGPATFYALFNS